MLPTGYWCTPTKEQAATPACTNPPSPTTQQSSLRLMLLVPSWMSSAEIFYLPWKYIHLLSKQIHINPKGKLWQYCRQQAAEVSQSFQLNLSVKSLPGRQTLIRLGTHFAVMWPNRNKRIRCILRLGIKLVHGVPVEAGNETGLKNSFSFSNLQQNWLHSAHWSKTGWCTVTAFCGTAAAGRLTCFQR